MRWADFRGAKFSGADLRGTDMSGEDLRGTDLRVYHAEPWGAYITTQSISIGCKLHAPAEWWGFSDSEIGAMDQKALEYWRENKDSIKSIWESLRAER